MMLTLHMEVLGGYCTEGMQKGYVCTVWKDEVFANKLPTM